MKSEFLFVRSEIDRLMLSFFKSMIFIWCFMYLVSLICFDWCLLIEYWLRWCVQRFLFIHLTISSLHSFLSFAKFLNFSREFFLMESWSCVARGFSIGLMWFVLSRWGVGVLLVFCGASRSSRVPFGLGFQLGGGECVQREQDAFSWFFTDWEYICQSIEMGFFDYLWVFIIQGYSK